MQETTFRIAACVNLDFTDPKWLGYLDKLQKAVGQMCEETSYVHDGEYREIIFEFESVEELLTARQALLDTGIAGLSIWTTINDFDGDEL